MRININRLESYNLELPESINLAELSSLADRFNRLLKVFSKEIPDTPQTQSKTVNPIEMTPEIKANRLKLRDRAYCVELIKIYYGTDKNKRLEVQESLGCGKGNAKYKFSTMMANVRNKFNITCNEVGITRFPTIKDTSYDYVTI